MTIKTLMFLDLETTGLPTKECVPKITELTLLCVLRSDIERADINNLPPVSKLTYIFNPRIKISPGATRITGITNEFLVNQPVFRDKIKCITEFLDAPKPICLVAHNGNRFDFKILKNEFANANAILPRGLYCVDTLKAFKDILNNHIFKPMEISNETKQKFDSSDTDLGEDPWPDLNVTPEDWKEIDDLINSFSDLTTTPNPKTGEKNLPPTYTLTDIYKTLLKKEPLNLHRAEADCMALLECVISTKQYFLPWADKNYNLLSCIKPF